MFKQLTGTSVWIERFNSLGEAASLPVPNTHRPPHRPVIAPQQSLRSASGEVEQKREWVFPQKSGKSRSRFCGAEKREEPFAFLRLFLLAPADLSRVRLRPVRGTGTLPDAGGAGGRRTRPRLLQPCNGQSGVYLDRAPRGDCNHRDSCLDAAARVESGA